MIHGYFLAPRADQVRHTTDPDEMAGLYRRQEGLLWVDVEAASPEETDLLRTHFDLHPVALEVCREVTAQPLIHDYHAYLFMVIHAVNFAPKTRGVATLEVDIRWGRHLVLTYHRDPVRTLTALRHTCAEEGGAALLARGTDFFVHAVVDRILDNFTPTLQRLDDRIDEAETRVFRRPTDAILQEVLALKRSSAYLGRIAAAQRDAVGRIVRGEFPHVTKQALAYWRDAYDHLVRMVQATDVQRDLISGVRDTYLSVVSNRMNEIMKVLTIIATIFMPITFIAGIYGMNFEWMPELGVWYAYPATLALMALVAGGMLLYFRRKKWF